jgi:clan AA aspartic protease (TIGR02281 family)
MFNYAGANRAIDGRDLTDKSTSYDSPTWGGTLYQRPTLYMEGMIENIHNTWHYSERLYERKKNASPSSVDRPPGNLVMHASAECVRLDAPTMTASAPTPEAPPQIAPPPADVAAAPVPLPTSGDSVPIYVDRGGRAVRVDVQLGSMTQRMLIDTGATQLSVPKSVASDLLQRGEATLDEAGQVTIADGSSRAQTFIRVATVRVGGHILHDIDAGVMPDGAEPLLGFPVLNQAGKFTIDTTAGQLIFG